jgi:N-acetylmuramoyl-L-alanine amidase
MASALGDTLKSNGPMHANFAVTRNSEIPSCLVEVDFVTSPPGEEAIWNAARRRVVAEAIASGIDKWRTGTTKDK